MSTTVGRATPVARARLPLVGHAWSLNRRPLEFARSLRSYGEMVQIFVGPKPVYVVNSADLIGRVLVTEAKKFDKGALFDELRDHLGNGLITSAGTFHQRQRRLVQPAFRADQIARYADLMVQQTMARVTSWVPDRPLEMTREIDALVLDVLLATMFAEEPDPEVLAAIHRSLSVKQGSMKRALSPARAWLDRLPATAARRKPNPAAAGMRELWQLLGRIVRQRREEQIDHGDLLSMLLMADDPRTGEAMTDEELCDELVTLFVAGTGTVSAALAWAFHEIATRPEVEARFLEEVDAVLGGRAPAAADVGELRYTRRVLQEVLRQHPVWLLMRRSVAPVELGGIELAPGAEVFFSPYALHRDPELYPDPDRFDPDRWLPERGARVVRGTYVPFGAGNRLCLGEGFAWTEMTIVLAATATRWQMQPVPGDEVRARIGTVDRPERLPMVPVARNA